jgi:hypothetical protein
MLNMPPNLPETLPTAEGERETRSTGSQHTYDFPGAPQRLGNTDQHRFFMPYDVGVWLNGDHGGAMTPGLAAGQTVTYNVDSVPDWWIIALTSESSTLAAVRVYFGPGVGGQFVRLGSSGNLKLPAQGQNYLTLFNAGTGTAFGTVIATKGFDDDEIRYHA